MIAIIIGIIAVIILTVLTKKDSKDEPDWFSRFEKRMFLLMAVVLAVVVDVIAWGIYSGAAVEVTKTTEVVATAKLVTLQDNAAPAGKFFLGSGNLSNKPYYAFYYETEHGYTYKTLDAESSRSPVYIKYISAEETPHIDRYSTVERMTMTGNGSKSWCCSIIAWLVYHQYGPGDLVSEKVVGPSLVTADTPNYYDSWRYEIHIPEGSIKTDYTIDLE